MLLFCDLLGLDEFAGQTSTHALRTPSTQAPKETWFKARCNASKRVCLSNARQVYLIFYNLFCALFDELSCVSAMGGMPDELDLPSAHDFLRYC
jgi:hypothetical protein